MLSSICKVDPLILVVDDSPQNLVFICDVLRGIYDIRTASSGLHAMNSALVHKPDLVLLDIKMPEISGYEVCSFFKSHIGLKDIPIIFLTSLGEEYEQAYGFSIGAADYIIKPISPSILKARIRNHLHLKAANDFLRDKSAFLEQEVNRRLVEISDVQDVTITALAALAEARDNETGNHILRTQRYVKALARAALCHPKFVNFLDDSEVEMLYKSAPLHDIGKVGIPDSILLKPGRLTAQEFEIMKTHTTMGFQSLENAEKRLGKPASFLNFAKEIAYHHQEKWDGSGYPLGLTQQQIPFSARLMAIADVYDALISKRVYKEAMSHELAVKIILDGRGVHFDPDLVDVFEQICDSFRDIALKFQDA
jgi:putative two-component system response regulator